MGAEGQSNAGGLVCPVQPSPPPPALGSCRQQRRQRGKDTLAWGERVRNLKATSQRDP